MGVFVLFSGGAGAQFSDSAASQYEPSILKMQERGLIEGYADGTYRPFASVNRAEFIKLVLTAAKVNTDANIQNCFPDVSTQWFAQYVCHGKQNKIVDGYPNGKFQPADTVNMVEAMKIMVNVFDFDAPVPAGGEWFDGYRDFFHNSSILSKYAYHPDRPMRREEIAYVLDTILKAQETSTPLTKVRDSRSVGCGVTKPGTAKTKYDVKGTQRSTIAYVPSSYTKDTPVPLVFAFHGRTNPNTQVRGYYDLEKANAAKNAIILYPAGNKVGSSYNWNNTYPFVDAMYKHMTENYCVDLDKVYVIGHSLGAYITNDVACVHGDKIRAAGSVGGGRTESNCTGPVANMIMHNPKDRLSAFSNGERARNLFVQQNKNNQETKPVAEPKWGNCVQYQGGHAYNPTVWCPHNVSTNWDGSYYPHTWPGGTAAAMWNFFEGLEEFILD